MPVSALFNVRSQQLLFIFGIFRLILASGLTVLVMLPSAANELLDIASIESLQLATMAYLVLTVVGMLVTLNEPRSHTAVSVLLITDALMIMMVMRYSGGVDSGFGNLLLISVGLGGLLLPLRQSLLMAAIATSATVYTELFPSTANSSRELLHAALLGIAFFVETFLLQYVGQRMSSTEQLAKDQANTILDLQNLNELIVQRMRTGIIVFDHQSNVQLINDAARDLLKLPKNGKPDLPSELIERLKQWRLASARQHSAFQINDEHQAITANFAHLQAHSKSEVIAFLEDTGRMNQAAQQLKLASLGRLTASIAHEIRNPLGAISHAAQLLDEAPSLKKDDQRLLSIIHSHSDRVNAIIETILELSRRKPTRLETISIGSLIEQCRTDRTLALQEKTEVIDVSLGTQFHISVDINQLQQVLHNLIENGLRYSHQATGSAAVSVKTGVLNDTSQFYLDIKDNGQGIPAEKHDQLFEPFYTSEPTGTGLGLYIAKELCEANRINLVHLNSDTTQKAGTTFRLIFSHAISQSEPKGNQP